MLRGTEGKDPYHASVRVPAVVEFTWKYELSSTLSLATVPADSAPVSITTLAGKAVTVAVLKIGSTQ